MTIRWLWTIHQSCLIPIEAQRTCQPRRHSGSGSDDRSPGALNLSKSVSDTSSASRILTFLYIYILMDATLPEGPIWVFMTWAILACTQLKPGSPGAMCPFSCLKVLYIDLYKALQDGCSTAAAFKDPTLKRMVMVEKNCCGLYDMDQKSIRQKNMDKLGEHPNMVYRCLLSEYLLKFHQGTLSN